MTKTNSKILCIGYLITGAMACSTASMGPTKGLPTEEPGIILDGKGLSSFWLDGDTVRLQLNDSKKITARLAGFNTLESYAPIHKWGTWTPHQLMDIASQATSRAKSGTWHCTTLPGSGGYRRIKIDCPQLRHSLLRSGLAHVFAMGDSRDPTDLQTQNFAKSHGLGMWAKGVPRIIITNVRSNATPPGQMRIYDTHVSTQTGEVQFRKHTSTYSPCQFVCAGNSCIQFIPKTIRYNPNRQTSTNTPIHSCPPEESALSVSMGPKNQLNPREALRSLSSIHSPIVADGI